MLAVIVAGLVASALSMHEAQAAQINGTIGFAGSVRFDSSVLQTVHQVNVWHDVNGNLGLSNVAAFTGDFMGHVVLGQQATMHTPWIFIPSTDTPVLWAVGGVLIPSPQLSCGTPGRRVPANQRNGYHQR